MISCCWIGLEPTFECAEAFGYKRSLHMLSGDCGQTAFLKFINTAAIAVVSDRIIGRKPRNCTSHELVEKRDGKRHVAMRWTEDHPLFYQIRPGRS